MTKPTNEELGILLKTPAGVMRGGGWALVVANNVSGVATVEGMAPDGAGEITVALSPGPNNNNGNHFTHLGVMQVDTTPVRTPAVLIDFGAAATPTVFGAGDPENHWTPTSACFGSVGRPRLPQSRWNCPNPATQTACSASS